MNGMTRIHLIGVCGTAMATLAALLKSRGYDVRGSDQNVYPPMSDFLREQGITTLQGYRAEHISADIDLVVVGNAISRGNPELEEVLDRKIRYCSLPEAVRDHFLWGARSIVIAGTHGKTTTTSLTGWLLAHGGADPSVFIGGISENFESSYRVGGGREFVIGGRYDSAFFDKTAKFLKYLPDIGVVNNIEFDHADIYADLAAIRVAFQRFVNLIPRRGFSSSGRTTPKRRRWRAARSAGSRRLESRTTPTGRRTISGSRALRRRSAFVAGASRSAVSSCRCSARSTCATRSPRSRSEPRSGSTPTRWRLRFGLQGRQAPDAAAGHGGWRFGVRRLRAPPDRHRRDAGRRADGVSNRRLWAIFEPRSATSCRRIFQSDFARALSAADTVVLPAVFRSNLPEDQRLSAEQLVAI